MWLSSVPVTSELKSTVRMTVYCPCKQCETINSPYDCLLSLKPIRNNQQSMWLSIVPVTNVKQPTVHVTVYCSCNQWETSNSPCDCLLSL